MQILLFERQMLNVIVKIVFCVCVIGTVGGR